MTDIDKAREWASGIEHLAKVIHPDAQAAIEIIQSLPDQWVDVEKVREVTDRHNDLIVDFLDQFVGDMHTDTWEAIRDFMCELNVEVDALAIPKLLTLADMTQEERAACKWMQAKVFPTASTLGIITNVDEYECSAIILFADGMAKNVPWDLVTPLPGEPKLQWPGSEPESTHFDNLPDEAKQVMKESIEDFKAGRFVDFDLEESDSDQSPRPEGCCGKCPETASGGWDCTCEDNPRCSKNTPNPADVPANEPWLIEANGQKAIGTRHKGSTIVPWSVAALDGSFAGDYNDNEITLIHKLVSETHALPEGMRLADHEKYGRVVVSPKVDTDGDYKAFLSDPGEIAGATWKYAHKSKLTFLDGDQRA